MVYLFAIPLLLGVVPQLIALANPKLSSTSSWQRIIHNFAIVTLIVGSILQGVVEIYGTTNGYIVYYFIVGISLLVASSMLWVAKFLKLHIEEIAS